ncbi:MAG: hypothetical protein WBG80_03750, partial [Bacteroidota bacterium]
MASLKETLQQATVIETTQSGPVVEQTVADELRREFSPSAQIKRGTKTVPAPGTVRVAVVDEKSGWKAFHPALKGDSPWMMVRAKPGAGIEIVASAPHLLFTLYTAVAEEWLNLPVGQFSEGRISFPTFRRFRPSYDSFLTQHNRTAQDFDREEHIRNLARMGFSHAEVNGLAFALPFEQGPKGEVLHRFYTYCAALDQFVTSKLNAGFYDNDYLQANLNSLKRNADLAMKYGLRPGITCFEPRSVPDALLARYPMLRGARVDHPIRSWHPRYNLSIAHPVVRDHYAEMMENLMHEVP